MDSSGDYTTRRSCTSGSLNQVTSASCTCNFIAEVGNLSRPVQDSLACLSKQALARLPRMRSSWSPGLLLSLLCIAVCCEAAPQTEVDRQARQLHLSIMIMHVHGRFMPVCHWIKLFRSNHGAEVSSPCRYAALQGHLASSTAGSFNSNATCCTPSCSCCMKL